MLYVFQRLQTMLAGCAIPAALTLNEIGVRSICAKAFYFEQQSARNQLMVTGASDSVRRACLPTLLAGIIGAIADRIKHAIT
jgi:hypothetical protein